MFGSQVTFCYNIGSIIGNGNNVGGIVGRASEGGKIEYCYNNGNINTTGKTAGGIIGSIYKETNDFIKNYYINNCYNLADITGTKVNECNTGGILGASNGYSDNITYLNNIYNKGNISNGQFVGGITGYTEYTTLQGNVLNYGAVTNYISGIGGICGQNGGGNTNDFIKRAYGGNCSSSLKANGNGNTNAYDANLVMPSVYSVVSATNTGEFSTVGRTENNPKLNNIE